MNTEKTTTRKHMRDEAKKIGYKIRFKTNSLNPELAAVGFVVPGTDHCTLGANVFPGEFVRAHKEAFDLLNSFRGYRLTDTGQRLAK